MSDVPKITRIASAIGERALQQALGGALSSNVQQAAVSASREPRAINRTLLTDELDTHPPLQ